MQPDDTALMQRINQQDQSALALLYERYGTQVYSLTYRILQDKRLAEEATQDTFLKVWRQSRQWDSQRGKLSSWLLTIARHTAIDLLRMENRQVKPNTAALDSVPEPAAKTGNPESKILQDGRLLREFMTQLPEEQAQVIELAFFRGMTHREMSDRLELPLGTVKTRVRLGLQKLRGLWESTEIEATKSETP